MSRKSPNLSCRVCGHTDPVAAAGARCPDHPDVVLVPRRVLDKYKKDTVLGTVVGGKYAVVSILGVGGFGAVYRAVQEPVGRHVALKVVHAQHVEDADMRARFFREAKVVARLGDPSVVTLFDYGEEANIGLYMVFELVVGRSLAQVIRDGPQEAVWTAHIMLQVLRALGEAHRLGMVHRDIKPANLMVVENTQGQESVRVLDFGIAKVAPRENQESSLKTREGMVLGTPQYMSPEQAKASTALDARSDLYSLAVVAYTLIAGKNPFERASMVETIMAHVGDEAPPFSTELHVPQGYEAVLLKALEKEPSQRFQTAEEMSAAIVAAFPNVAFPSLSYEFRAPPARPEPSLLGAVLEGPLTPTPNASSAAAAGLISPTAPAPVSGSSLPPISSSPISAAISGVVPPGSASGSAASAASSDLIEPPVAEAAFTELVPGSGSMPPPEVGATLGASVDEMPSTARSKPSRTLIIGLLLLLLSLGAFAGLTILSGDEQAVRAKALPTEPIPRAKALLDRQTPIEAARVLNQALAEAGNEEKRNRLLASIQAAPRLAPLLKRPELEVWVRAASAVKAPSGSAETSPESASPSPSKTSKSGAGEADQAADTAPAKVKAPPPPSRTPRRVKTPPRSPRPAKTAPAATKPPPVPTTPEKKLEVPEF